MRRLEQFFRAVQTPSRRHAWRRALDRQLQQLRLDLARLMSCERSSAAASFEDVRFYEVVNAIQDYAILLLDPAGRVATWNLGAQRLKGYAAKQVIGRHFSIFYPREAVDRHHPERVLELARVHGRYEEEAWRVRKDGSRFWANVVISTRRDRAGNVVGFVKVTRDLTERRSAEEDLRRAKVDLERRVEERSHDLGRREKMLRLVTDALPMGVCYVDAQQRFRLVNATYAAWRGTTKEAMIGRRLREVVGEPLYEAMRPQIEAALSGESQLVDAEVQYHDKRRAIRAHSIPDLVDDGSVRGYVLIATDVTEQKLDADRKAFLAEASKMFASSLDYQTVLARLAHMLTPRLADWCTVDMLTEDRQLERVAVAHVDPRRVEWVREIQARLPRDTPATAIVRRVASSGKSELLSDVTDEALERLVGDPSRIALLREVGVHSLMVVPIEAHGRAVGAISFIASESGRCFAEADLAFAEEIGRRAGMAIHNARLYRDAQAANRIKDEFLATLSHELRTPLNSIVGWADLLRTRTVEPGEIDEAVGIIYRNAQAQAELINDLLDMSRIASGKMTIDPRPVDLGPVVGSAIAALRLAAQAKNIKVELATDADLVAVLGDPDRIQQVVWNLLSNAIKFTPKNGRVTVAVRRSGSDIEIEVEDSGEGIEGDFVPYLFQRFRQQDASMARRHGGLGIGLSIVRHIVEAHGGSVRAKSAGKGGGATFTVTLPAATAATRRADSRAVCPSRPPSGASEANGVGKKELARMRILVIDDDRSARQLLRKVLSQYGAEILEAESASEAIEMARSSIPDMILSDIGMPEEDGLSLIRRIRALPEPSVAKTPAIALTAYARDEEMAEALRAGFDAHLSKPIQAATLLGRIMELAQVRERRYTH